MPSPSVFTAPATVASCEKGDKTLLRYRHGNWSLWVMRGQLAALPEESPRS
jgi:hypothetical protein